MDFWCTAYGCQTSRLCSAMVHPSDSDAAQKYLVRYSQMVNCQTSLDARCRFNGQLICARSCIGRIRDATGEPCPHAMVFLLKSDPARSSKARGADDRFCVPTMRALALRALLHALHLAVSLIWPPRCDQPHSGLDIRAEASIPQPERVGFVFGVRSRPRLSNEASVTCP